MNSYKFDYYQYKQRINPKSKLSISLCLVVIILLIGATCFLRQNSNKIEFHFVEVGTFFNYKDANSQAIELQQKNAGGYIYFDGSYHVLACAYINKEDATNVAKNLSNQYPSAKQLTISTKEFNSKGFTKKETQTIKKVISANDKVINDLYATMVDFETNVINDNQFNIKIQHLSNHYAQETKDFLSMFKVNSTISTLKEKISTIQSCLDESLEGYKLKYNLIKIVITHYSFLEFFC